MKEHPFLFKPEMMRALLDGSKKQTRRLLTSRNTLFDGGSWPAWAKEPWNQWDWDRATTDPGPSPSGNPGPYLLLPHKDKTKCTHRIYPRIWVGDVIWCRESWSPPYDMKDVKPSMLPRVPIHYWANGDPEYGDWTIPKPSIHMPRRFCRALLPVTGLSIERLQNISGDDVWAEGVDNGIANKKMGVRWENAQRMAFERLWNSINEKSSHGWNENEWVIAYKWKEIQCPE